MNAFGSVVARTVATLGGAPSAAGLVVAGLVVGALGGVFVRAGQPAPTPDPGDPLSLPIHACPASGAPLVVAAPGQQLLLTGRSADGEWYRIHYPAPGRTEGWVPAAAIEPDGPVGALPVAVCAREQAIGIPAALPTLTTVGNFEPTPSPTPVPTPTPTPTPTPKPTPKPTPTPTPVDTTKPNLGTPSANPATIAIRDDPKCAPTTTTISVTARDGQSGITSVVLSYTDAQGVPRTRKMRRQGSTNTYRTTLDTATHVLGPPAVPYSIVATNGVGLTAASGVLRVIVVSCT